MLQVIFADPLQEAPSGNSSVQSAAKSESCSSFEDELSLLQLLEDTRHGAIRTAKEQDIAKDALQVLEALDARLARSTAALRHLESRVDNDRQTLKNQALILNHPDIKGFSPADAPLNLVLHNEIEFEVSRAPSGTTLPQKSKLVLALIEGFSCPAFFGVDRCYMGQPCLGTIKGLTLGGLFVWYLMDYIVVLLNMFQQEDFIDTIGFQAYFGENDLRSALIASIVLLVYTCCCAGGGMAGGGKMFWGRWTPYEGTYECIRVQKSGEQHHVNRMTITGEEGIIVGDNNFIEGFQHQITGNYNVIEGKNCIVKGNGNIVNGMSHQVDGNGNDVNGLNNFVEGFHNKVSGLNQGPTETAAFDQKEFDRYQSFRTIGPQADPGLEQGTSQGDGYAKADPGEHGRSRGGWYDTGWQPSL